MILNKTTLPGFLALISAPDKVNPPTSRFYIDHPAGLNALIPNNDLGSLTGYSESYDNSTSEEHARMQVVRLRESLSANLKLEGVLVLRVSQTPKERLVFEVACPPYRVTLITSPFEGFYQQQMWADLFTFFKYFFEIEKYAGENILIEKQLLWIEPPAN